MRTETSLRESSVMLGEDGFPVDPVEETHDDEGPVGATVLDDILIRTGYSDAAILASKGPEATIKSEASRAQDVMIDRIKDMSLEELQDQIAQREDGEDLLSDEEDLMFDRELAIMQAVAARKMQQQHLEENSIHQDGSKTVEEIDIEEFEEKVSVRSEERNVVMVIYKKGDAASDLLLQCIEKLSRKFRGIIWVKVAFSPLIKGFPPEDAPAVMCYSAGTVIAQLPTLRCFAGMQTTPEIVEWELAKKRLLISDLEDDPRGPFKLSIQRGSIRHYDEEDDDW
jgi:hypothetical protein